MFAMEMSTRWRQELTWRCFLACAITIVVVRTCVTTCVSHGQCANLKWGSLIWFQVSPSFIITVVKPRGKSAQKQSGNQHSGFCCVLRHFSGTWILSKLFFIREGSSHKRVMIGTAIVFVLATPWLQSECSLLTVCLPPAVSVWAQNRPQF